MILPVLVAFALTVAVESAVLLAIERSGAHLYPLFLCNLLTNPLLNALLALAVWIFGITVYWPLLAVLELGVLAAETLLMRKMCGYTPKRSLLICLACNGASLLAGFALRPLFA